MTALERVLSTRDTAFAQIYCDENLNGELRVGIVLMDEDREVLKYEGESVAMVLEAFDKLLEREMFARAALAFWDSFDEEEEGRKKESQKQALAIAEMKQKQEEEEGRKKA